MVGQALACGPAFQRVQPAGRPAAGRVGRPTSLRENRWDFGRTALAGWVRLLWTLLTQRAFPLLFQTPFCLLLDTAGGVALAVSVFFPLEPIVDGSQRGMSLGEVRRVPDKRL